MNDGRPYSTLGAKPFWSIDDDDWKTIERRYRELSRLTHPDRVGPADREALARAESDSARLNLDYSILRDFHRRLEASLGDRSASVGKAAAPALAAEWFEVQEALADAGPGSPEHERALGAFAPKARAALEAAEARLREIANRHPFAGLSEPGIALLPPWSADDIADLTRALDERRYLARLVAELPPRP